MHPNFYNNPDELEKIRSDMAAKRRRLQTSRNNDIPTGMSSAEPRAPPQNNEASEENTDDVFRDWDSLNIDLWNQAGPSQPSTSRGSFSKFATYNPGPSPRKNPYERYFKFPETPECRLPIPFSVTNQRATQGCSQNLTQENKDSSDEDQVVEPPQDYIRFFEIEIEDAPDDYHTENNEPEKSPFEPSIDPDWL